jgi:hypothetical protein
MTCATCKFFHTFGWLDPNGERGFCRIVLPPWLESQFQSAPEDYKTNVVGATQTCSFHREEGSPT